MNGFSMALVAAASLSVSVLGAGCVGGDDENLAVGADANAATWLDAAPLPDASRPPDATPTAAPDAAQPPFPGDLPVELACTLDDVQPILECVTENCVDSLSDGTLLSCVTFSCGLLLLTTPPECTQCLITGLSDSSMALDACVLGLDDLTP